ncbi:MAG: DUF1844 domain-containing protein [Proteobacteria bacterium]|nr:DUF1844 domain-containing protein [Pseudomonadota bacterium]MBU4009188.1 DUF1844 domain-containing protein [Pseudomonadota bacterium]
MPEDKKDFSINDRRIFSQEKVNDKAEKKEFEDSIKQEPKEAEPSVKNADEKKAQTCLPEINFPTFIMSLNASALMNLGLFENPATGEKEKNHDLAKQTIDILSMLEEKTKGNLSKDEERMLRSILYDLRIIYVKEKK